MVTISDAETTEVARQESIRDVAPTITNEDAAARIEDRVTMPAPPAAIGRFSIEMNVPSAEVDFKASFERGAYREALVAARERLSVSPADTSALRVAQRSEEALVADLVATLGGATALVTLLRAPSETDASTREARLMQRLLGAPLDVRALLDTTDMGRIEVLDLVIALQARGHVRVNLSDQKTTRANND
jgi:hypothetical protein